MQAEVGYKQLCLGYRQYLLRCQRATGRVPFLAKMQPSYRMIRKVTYLSMITVFLVFTNSLSVAFLSQGVERTTRGCRYRITPYWMSGNPITTVSGYWPHYNPVMQDIPPLYIYIYKRILYTCIYIYMYNCIKLKT